MLCQLFIHLESQIKSSDGGAGFLVAAPEAQASELQRFIENDWTSSITSKRWIGAPKFESHSYIFLHPGATDVLALGAREAMGLAAKQLKLPDHFEVRSFKFFLKQSESIGSYFNPAIHISLASQEELFSYISQLETLKKEIPFKKPSLVESSVENLTKLSELRNLALSETEILKIVDFFNSSSVQGMRLRAGLPSLISDIEIELIAQTWSEHCKHKIFNAEISYEERGFEPSFKENIIKSIFKTFIQKPTLEILPNKKFEILSVFSDNAGIVSFDSDLSICAKVETHNSPSALDPYSGALTGVLGVNRDILGTGRGAKPIANINVLGFCSPEEFPSAGSEATPVGLLRPEVVMKGVHKGIEAAGNQSGVPTVAGAIVFDQGYAGKPLVFAGSLGVSPKVIKKAPTHTKPIQSGDYLFVGGGRVGRDGIHGATMSSLSMNEFTHQGMVQLGDPYMQKKLTDFLLKARDAGLYRTLTDNGAGGLGSSVGELSYLAGGARLDLAQVKLKYSNMEPWEILVSESQERMTFVVPLEFREGFESLATSMDIEVQCLGEFNNSGVLDVFWKSQIIAQVPLEFLHEGCPQLKLKGLAHPAQDLTFYFAKEPRRKLPETISARSVREMFEVLLSSLELRSRESWVRSFDFEVQDTNLRRSFSGANQEAPMSGGLINLEPLGSKKRNALGIGLGINPYLCQFDPYWMSMSSFDEALRNLVCSGVDPERVVALDNFSWPDPIKNELAMGQLVRASFGLREACLGFQIPLISGKDSLKNSFQGKNKKGEKIEINSPGTLLVTMIGEVPNVDQRMQPCPQVGDLLYFVGFLSPLLQGSVFSQKYEWTGPWMHQDVTPKELLHSYQQIHQLIKDKCFTHIQDISEGGMLAALFELSLFGSFGLDLSVDDSFEWQNFFSEPLGGFVVSVKPSMVDTFKAHLSKTEKVQMVHLGCFSQSDQFRLEVGKSMTFTEMSELKKIWQGHS